MSLKTLFESVTKPVVRFFERQEIYAAESSKQAAEAGYGYVAARGGAVKVRITPEKAQATIESCDNRLAVLYKRHPDMAPKP